MSRRTRIISLTLLAVVIAISSAVAGRSASSAPLESTKLATAPGKNGRIAFRRWFDSNETTGAIFTINANGKGERQITPRKAGVGDDHPDWSADGSRLTFDRCMADVPCAVYTVGANGGNLTRVSPPCSESGPDVTTKCEEGSHPSFLPDGSGIVFGRATGTVKAFPIGGDWIEHSEIAVRNTDGSNLRVLVASKPYEGDLNDAQFAPDGKRFLYVRTNSPATKPAGRSAIFVANADGSGEKQITPWSLDAGDGPDWSPNGRLIVFRSFVDEGAGSNKYSQVYVVRSDGSGVKRLTKFGAGTIVTSSSFSPDGKWITTATQGLGGNADVYVMHANGTGMRQVTKTKLWDSAPDWGPKR